MTENKTCFELAEEMEEISIIGLLNLKKTGNKKLDDQIHHNQDLVRDKKILDTYKLLEAAACSKTKELIEMVNNGVDPNLRDCRIIFKFFIFYF